MNTHPKRHEAIDKIVHFKESDRLELLGYLLIKCPKITDLILEFNPTQE